MVSTSALLMTMSEPLPLAWASVYPPGTAGDVRPPRAKLTDWPYLMIEERRGAMLATGPQTHTGEGGMETPEVDGLQATHSPPCA